MPARACSSVCFLAFPVSTSAVGHLVFFNTHPPDRSARPKTSGPLSLLQLHHHTPYAIHQHRYQGQHRRPYRRQRQSQQRFEPKHQISTAYQHHRHRRHRLSLMAASSQQTTPTGSSPGDPLELLDLSEYDGLPYQSPSMSPSATNKMHFARPTVSMATTPATMPPTQMLSGPSHQYDQYKQQTPFVPGALANTLAINEGNVHISGYNLEYINPGEELFDFNSTSQSSMTPPTMDLDFESPSDQAFFYSTTPNINPHTLTSASPAVPTPANTVGRMYPGMHQRAALAKAQAQAQQMQQQQEMIQRQQGHQRRQQQSKPSRQKITEPADPIVEQKITQLLNSMRSKVNTSETDGNSPLLQVPRPKKEEDDMDDDERLLASEEGKKLRSKERRQLRNKVSARAFRSRRKGGSTPKKMTRLSC